MKVKEPDFSSMFIMGKEIPHLSILYVENGDYFRIGCLLTPNTGS